MWESFDSPAALFSQTVLSSQGSVFHAVVPCERRESGASRADSLFSKHSFESISCVSHHMPESRFCHTQHSCMCVWCACFILQFYFSLFFTTNHACCELQASGSNTQKQHQSALATVNFFAVSCSMHRFLKKSRRTSIACAPSPISAQWESAVSQSRFGFLRAIALTEELNGTGWVPASKDSTFLSDT